MELNESTHPQVLARGQEKQLFKTNRNSILQNFTENGKAEVLCKSCKCLFMPTKKPNNLCEQCHAWALIYRNIKSNKRLFANNFHQGVSHAKR